MTDLINAKRSLNAHSITLCRGDKVITDDGRGIAPIMKLIEDGVDLKGFCVADTVVGKAAAMLFAREGITGVYGKVMSLSAKKYLEEHGIYCEWESLTEKIINRAGTDICPMEKTVLNIEDYNEAYEALKKKLSEI